MIKISWFFFSILRDLGLNLGFLFLTHCISHIMLCKLSYCQLRARRALSLFKDVPLRTRRVLSPLCPAIAPFWFSTEHLWILIIAPLWLSTDDIPNLLTIIHQWMTKTCTILKAIVQYWWIWTNFHKSFKKCSILTPNTRKQPQTSLQIHLKAN